MYKGKCCCGIGVVSHLFSIAGIYLLAWGLIGSAKVGTVIRSPIFWGLFLLVAGFHQMSMANKFNSAEKISKKK